MDGRSVDVFREAVVGLVARRLGFPTRGNAFAYSHERGQELSGRLLQEAPRLQAYREDGTRFKAQNEDGSFPHLPGYDGPVG